MLVIPTVLSETGLGRQKLGKADQAAVKVLSGGVAALTSLGHQSLKRLGPPRPGLKNTVANYWSS
jgi:hypothetical protein